MPGCSPRLDHLRGLNLNCGLKPPALLVRATSSCRIGSSSLRSLVHLTDLRTGRGLGQADCLPPGWKVHADALGCSQIPLILVN